MGWPVAGIKPCRMGSPKALHLHTVPATVPPPWRELHVYVIPPPMNSYATAAYHYLGSGPRTRDGGHVGIALLPPGSGVDAVAADLNDAIERAVIAREPPAATPRPPPLTALGAPASPWRPTHRYTSSGGNGWTQTQTQRTTDTRTSHKGGRGPQTLTSGPYPIVNVAPRTQVRGGPARGLMRSPKNLPP